MVEVVIRSLKFTPSYVDFDGDGIVDYAVWHPSYGQWFVIPSSDPDTPISQQWGANGDIPVTADYDGDGKLDYAVWRPSNGTWYVIPSGGGPNIIQQWGAAGDVPVVGDYDGDGIADFAVWRPSDGKWYIIPSSNPSQPIALQWGARQDIPVPADYDGDGVTDIAVWRPSNGYWYVIPSTNPNCQLAESSSNCAQAIAQQWGGAAYTPVPGDYDGDDLADFAVWLSSNGTWYVIPSGCRVTTITISKQTSQFGDPGMAPGM